jgi:hypothetical protein
MRIAPSVVCTWRTAKVGVVGARIPTTDLDDDPLLLVLVEPVQRLAESHLCHDASVGARPDGSTWSLRHAAITSGART